MITWFMALPGDVQSFVIIFLGCNVFLLAIAGPWPRSQMCKSCGRYF